MLPKLLNRSTPGPVQRAWLPGWVHAALLACVPLSACSDPIVLPDGQGQRVSLELARTSTESTAPRTIASLSADPEKWVVTGAQAELRTFGSDSRASLAIVAATDVEYRIPLGASPGTKIEPFQRATLLLRSPRDGVPRELAVRVRTSGTEHASPSLALYASRETQSIAFDFPQLRDPSEAPIELIVSVSGHLGPFALEGVVLEALPRVSFLPEPAGGAQFIAIGRDLRPGYGLASGEDLGGTMRPGAVPAQDAHLAFSYGVPSELHVDGERLRLTVEVKAGREQLTESFAVEPSWNHASLALADLLPAGLGNLPLEVRFALDAPDGAVCAVAETRIESRGKQAPTVLFVTSDTHRADHLGAAHSAVSVQTPHLDALAQRGVLFERSFASTNITNPSHAALLTGIHPRDTRIVDNRHALAVEAETLAEHFARAGYTTWASVSARHLRPEISGLGQGFARFAVPEGIVQDAADAVHILEEWLPQAEDRPLFVWLHLFDAHHPYDPPAPFGGRYYAGSDPFDPALPDPGIPAKALPFDLEGLRDPEFPKAQYRAEVDYLDSVLGRALALPRFHHAITAVTADHGESLGEHGIWYSHGGLYPESLHVPLVLAYPGAPAATRVTATSSHLRIGRTLLELAGIPTAATFPGENLSREWLAQSAATAPVFALSDSAIIASITRGTDHLILHLRKHHRREAQHMKRKYQVELYDLAADPECLDDIVFEHRELARELCAELVEWLRSPASNGWVGARSDDAELLRGLRALGYSEEEIAESTGQADPEAAPAPWIGDDFDLDANYWLGERR